MKTILVVEDDNFISDLLCTLLQQNDHVPTAAFSGTEALLLLQQKEWDLVLLDLMLPGKTGEEVLCDIRKSSKVPVIVLTAKTDKETTVQLLQWGADDYIKKPFDNDELLARIEVQLRRAESEESITQPRTEDKESLHYKDIILKLNSYDAFISNTPAGLSKREFEILRLLMSHPKKVFTKNHLYEQVWNDEFFGDDNTLNVHISKLRAKLDALSPGTPYIQTVWGIGFRMHE